jgi:transcriptional regulator with XRE-family HTH domain
VKESDAVGPRIAEIRKRRGLTQAQLAQHAHTGLGYIKKVESGHASPSANWVGAVANALGVDASKIYGDEEEFLGSADQIGLIRRALATTDLVDSGRPTRSIDELQRAVAQVNAWRRDTKYAKIGDVLPGLIEQLLASGQTSGGGPAYTLLTDAYRAANTVAHKLGYTDLSITASERMEWAAEKSGDQLLLATVHYVRAATLARIGAGGQAMQLLVRAMSEIDPLVEEDETAAAVYSTLHMRAGVIAAAMANGDSARDHLAEAERLASGFGDKVVYQTPVGPTNVKLYQVCAEVDLGNVGKAVELAQALRIPDNMARERRAYGWLDVARAYLLARDTDAAIEALHESRAASPEHFRASRTAKAAVKTAGTQQRRASDGLRALANAAGIED